MPRRATTIELAQVSEINLQNITLQQGTDIPQEDIAAEKCKYYAPYED